MYKQSRQLDNVRIHIILNIPKFTSVYSQNFAFFPGEKPGVSSTSHLYLRQTQELTKAPNQLIK
jgi:hypothetical protein